MNEVAVQSNMFGLLDQSINRAFTSAPVLKDGTEIGTKITMMKRKDIAVLNGLSPKKDKDALNDLILKSSDGVLNMIKGEVAKLNGEWTGKTIEVKNTKDGERTMVIRLKTVNRAQLMSDERLAKALFPEVQYPSMTLEEKIAKVVQMRESQNAQLAENSVEV